MLPRRAIISHESLFESIGSFYIKHSAVCSDLSQLRTAATAAIDASYESSSDRSLQVGLAEFHGCPLPRMRASASVDQSVFQRAKAKTTCIQFRDMLF